MPDDAILEGALRSVARRLRLARSLQILADAAVPCAVAALVSFAGRHLLPAPVSTALSILLALGVFAVLCVATFRLLRRVDLTEAAAHADARVGLSDLLSTGWWFARERASGPWIDLARGRATHAARELEPARVAPVRVPRSGAVAAGLALLAVAVGTLAPPPDAQGERVAVDSTRRGAAPGGSEVDTLREMLAVATRRADRTAQATLERAIAALQDPDATPDAQQRALEDVKAMVGQRNLEAAAQMEGVQQLADALGTQERFKDVAAALRAGDARGAAEALKAMRQGDGVARPADDAAEAATGGTRPLLDDLKAALQGAANTDNTSLSQGDTVGKMQQAIDKVEEMARRLEAAGTYNQGQRKIAQQSMAAGRMQQQRAAQSGQAKGGPNAGSSPETGNADIAGGTMYRNQDDDPKNEPMQIGIGGGAHGDAAGESAGDPLLGEATPKLDARYRKEVVQGMESAGRDGPDTAFYAASRQADAKVGVRKDAQAAARYAGEDALGRERIALRHRTQVKQYFTPGSDTR
jgi:hypothetical protein